jgi:hypothetical protein
VNARPPPGEVVLIWVAFGLLVAVVLFGLLVSMHYSM